MTDLLDIRRLTIKYRNRKGSEIAVNKLDLRLSENQFWGILGESGAGKTTLALAILRLLPPNAEISDGSVRYRGHEIVDAPERRMRSIRGAEIAFIAQQPSLALNPVMKAIDQITEVIRVHSSAGSRERKQRAADLLAELGLGSDKRVFSAYPHELSGGQQQRLLLAQVLAAGPKLLLADEATAFLDIELREQLYSLLIEQRRRRYFSLVFITHNLADVRALADYVGVMYAGTLVEQSTVSHLLTAPLHPYTRLLLRSMPDCRERKGNESLLPTIPEPDTEPPTAGCCFASRCPERQARCTESEPSAVLVSPGHSVQCHLYAR